MKYFLSMSLDIHQQKISVGVYQGNYSEKKRKKWHGMVTYGITEEINLSVKFTRKFIGKINPSVKFAHELWKTNPNESTIVGWINPLIKTNPKPLLLSPNPDPNKS